MPLQPSCQSCPSCALKQEVATCFACPTCSERYQQSHLAQLPGWSSVSIASVTSVAGFGDEATTGTLTFSQTALQYKHITL